MYGPVGSCMIFEAGCERRCTKKAETRTATALCMHPGAYFFLLNMSFTSGPPFNVIFLVNIGSNDYLNRWEKTLYSMMGMHGLRSTSYFFVRV